MPVYLQYYFWLVVISLGCFVLERIAPLVAVAGPVDRAEDPVPDALTRQVHCMEDTAMAWIKTIPFTEADPALRAALDAQQRLYPKEYAREPGDDGASSIVATHSLIPDALHHAFATFGVLMSPDLPLARRQHEMITTVVSATNRCHY